MELPLGSDVAGYTVERQLGRGGMAVVYRVRHREQGTLHALKVLRHADARLAVRLRLEGRLQARLVHPNLVRVTEIVEVRGQPGLVMEYVAGPSLGELLAAVRELSVSEVDSLGRRLLRGVAAAHVSGWVHRDLKPANVLLDLQGTAVEPRVTDFGLASATDETELGTLTRHGAGTRRYMSLEQLIGAPPEPAMDVFALGAVLFELVDGVPAFPTLGSWNDALRSGRYPSPARANVPERIRDAIRSALADRGARVPDASALLARWEAGTPEPDSPFRDETLALLVLASAHPPVERLLAGSPEDSAHLALCPSCRDEARRLPGLSEATPAVPTELDGFVGREADLADLQRRLAAGERAITIHGPAGIGKTRLVVRYARLHRDSAVWICDLAEARDLDGIARAVARGLGVLLDRADPVAELGHAIAGRGRCVVVLDNFEQVAAHAGATIGAWCAVAPEASFVTTSRIVLGIPGEQVLRIEPLEKDDATALFVQRATAVNPDFDPAADPEGVRRLVALLDGLPLAIELCAVRVRMMPPARIAERMDDRFRILAGGRGRSDRHATLRAALDWSWGLLTAWEQAALAQCSVFAGGFDLAAAERILDLGAWPDAPWPIDVLQALVDESLVRVLSDGRFALLVSIRDYAAERLGADQGPGLRHAAWYAELADAAEKAERPLVAELDNLMAAARSALSVGDADLAARAAIGAARVVEQRGPLGDAHALLVEVRGRPLPRLTGARVDAALGALVQALGRPTEALQWLDAALTGFRELGERWHEASALGTVSLVAWETGDGSSARVALEEALALHRAAGERGREGRALNGLASIALEAGHLEQASELYQTALALVREAGTPEDEGIVLSNLANMSSVVGRHDDAVRLYEQALAIHRRIGHRKHEGRVVMNLGGLHQSLGRLDLARVCHEAALAAYREVGDRRSEGMLLGSLGALAVLEERFAEAAALFERGLSLIRETGNRRSEAAVLGNVGLMHGLTGRPEQAQSAFEAAAALYRGSGNRRGEGVVLGRLAQLHADFGAIPEARARLADAEALLAAVGDRNQLGILACIRAKVCSAGGDAEGARAALEEAERLAIGVNAQPGSTLRHFLTRLAATIPR